MQRKFTQLLRLLLIIFAFGITQNANAQACDGEAVVKIGETTTVYLGATYQRTLSKATGVSFDWYNYDNSIIITRETKNYAEIKGKKATTSGKLYFTCSYYLDGFRLSMSFYYDIEVRNNIVYVTKVEVTPSSATMIVGEKLKLTDNIYPTNATEQGVTWRSSAPNTVQVWQSGLAEALSPGSATITCCAIDGSGEYATCDITVIPAEPTAVNITTEETSISVGETLKLDYSITPAGATTEVEWESDNTAVATVNDEGIITAIGIGEANITVTTANGLTDSYQITVTAATSGGIPVNGKFEVDGIYYNIIDSVTKTVEVTYKGNSYYEYSNEYTDSVVIPETVTCAGITYSVTSIGSFAFYYCTGLSKTNIPNSVTSIGDYAFYHCTGLSEINIPNSVTSIGYSTFSSCCSLTEITIPNSVTSIGTAAFSGCSILTKITIPNSITSIEDYVFRSCSSLTEITIPNSVTSIGDYAFSNCTSLTEITIPNSVTSIDDLAFEYCNGLSSITVAEDNKKYDSRDNCNAIIETSTNTLIVGCKNTLISNSVTSIGNFAFYYCSGLTEITIPNSITLIGNFAFCGCSGLTKIILPNSVTSIGNFAFGHCSGLAEIIISNSVASIENHAFYYCSGLTEITIPNSVTSIGSAAFSGCTELTKITIPNSITSIGDYAFSSCSGLTEINIPNLVSSIGEGVFSDCTGLTEIIVSESNINYDSRDNCNSIIETSTNTLMVGCKNTIIPNSVTSIGDCAFFSCSDLTEITIPNSVTSIGNHAFYDCSGLTEINIPNSVSSIGEGAFSSCRGLTEINIPNSVITVGSYAFWHCSSLTEITIPNSVTSIGECTFSGCSGLTEITSLNPIPPECGGYCFEDVPTTCVLKVPAGSKELYAEAEGWSQFVNIVEIASVGVSTQENNATFAIPTTEGAATYTVNVYSDEAMTQLVATTDYYEPGRIVPMSTSLELSIDGFDIGTYYYDVIVKSETGETLGNYTGTFEIETNGIEEITQGNDATEVARYDIHGRPLAKPTKGVNIVVFSDGTTRKEVVR